MEKEIVKKYNNGELTIEWHPKKCIHAGICVQVLPKVYKPREKPWLTIENATTEELKAQVKQCPSGALTCHMNDDKKEIEGSTRTQIEVLADGPLLVHGTLEVKGSDGQSISKETTTAFCRCGASSNKPYCDGTHRKINFIR